MSGHGVAFDNADRAFGADLRRLLEIADHLSRLADGAVPPSNVPPLVRRPVGSSDRLPRPELSNWVSTMAGLCLAADPYSHTVDLCQLGDAIAELRRRIDPDQPGMADVRPANRIRNRVRQHLRRASDHTLIALTRPVGDSVHVVPQAAQIHVVRARQVVDALADVLPARNRLESLLSVLEVEARFCTEPEVSPVLVEEIAHVASSLRSHCARIVPVWERLPTAERSNVPFRPTLTVGLNWVHAQEAMKPALLALRDQDFDIATRTASAGVSGVMELRSWLESGTCDVVLGGPPDQSPRHVSVEAYRTELVAVIPDGHPLARRSRAGLPLEAVFDPALWSGRPPSLLVMTTAFFCRRRLDQECQRIGVDHHQLEDVIRDESSSATALVAFMAAGRGIAVLSADALPASVGAATVAPLLTPDGATIEQVVCAHHLHGLTPHRQEMVDRFLAALPSPGRSKAC